MHLVETVAADADAQDSGGSRPADAPSICAVLVRAQVLSDDAMARARAAQQDSGERFAAVVTRLGLISEEALSELLARSSGVALAPAGWSRDPAPLEPRLSAEFLRDIQAVPFAMDERIVRVAVVDPFDPFVAQALGATFGRQVERVIARSSDIETAIAALCAEPADRVAVEDAFGDEDVERLRDLVSDAPAIRMVNRIIAEAVDERASDIHLEPTEDSLVVRFRVDGMLREVARLPQGLRAPVVSRIKVVAGLDLAERRLPQDGRLRIAVRGHDTDLRVATAPSLHGESVVLRILDRSRLTLDFDALGFDAELAEAVRAVLHRPHGIVLVTGPTGSGKTTTLYAALSDLNQVDRKLLTVEDPVEYRLSGVIQTQVQPGIGLTFASALRSFLRQDPDVIMVGEIRDTETAQIAVQAALTGHTILATLHTNSAAGAVTRLLDMGVEPFLLGSVLNGVLAQRLVRRLCAACRQPFEPGDRLRETLGLGPGHYHRAVGCPTCHHTGYAGRLALFEFLRIDEDIAQQIVQRADVREIERSLRERRARTLLSDGLARAASGMTTIEEVLRAVGGE